jgi:hypothetical protein
MSADKKLLYTRKDLRRAIGQVEAERTELVYSRDDLRETAAEMGLSADRVEAAALVGRVTGHGPELVVESLARRVCKVGLGSAILTFVGAFGWHIIFAHAPPAVVYLKVAGPLGTVFFGIAYALVD